mmetsp:Transcript_32007/g.53976  ORF Transcript_32007/g.53976 Transcript_32007/m.53976 type:complete len:832 (-) Transcript_32007:2-2497(-)
MSTKDALIPITFSDVNLEKLESIDNVRKILQICFLYGSDKAFHALCSVVSMGKTFVSPIKRRSNMHDPKIDLYVRLVRSQYHESKNHCSAQDLTYIEFARSIQSFSDMWSSQYPFDELLSLSFLVDMDQLGKITCEGFLKFINAVELAANHNPSNRKVALNRFYDTRREILYKLVVDAIPERDLRDKLTSLSIAAYRYRLHPLQSFFELVVDKNDSTEGGLLEQKSKGTGIAIITNDSTICMIKQLIGAVNAHIKDSQVLATAAVTAGGNCTTGSSKLSRLQKVKELKRRAQLGAYDPKIHSLPGATGSIAGISMLEGDLDKENSNQQQQSISGETILNGSKNGGGISTSKENSNLLQSPSSRKSKSNKPTITTTSTRTRTTDSPRSSSGSSKGHRRLRSRGSHDLDQLLNSISSEGDADVDEMKKRETKEVITSRNCCENDDAAPSTAAVDGGGSGGDLITKQTLVTSELSGAASAVVLPVVVTPNHGTGNVVAEDALRTSSTKPTAASVPVVSTPVPVAVPASASAGTKLPQWRQQMDTAETKLHQNSTLPRDGSIARNENLISNSFDATTRIDLEELEQELRMMGADNFDSTSSRGGSTNADGSGIMNTRTPHKDKENHRDCEREEDHSSGFSDSISLAYSISPPSNNISIKFPSHALQAVASAAAVAATAAAAHEEQDQEDVSTGTGIILESLKQEGKEDDTLQNGHQQEMQQSCIYTKSVFMDMKRELQFIKAENQRLRDELDRGERIAAPGPFSVLSSESSVTTTTGTNGASAVNVTVASHAIQVMGAEEARTIIDKLQLPLLEEVNALRDTVMMQKCIISNIIM